ncbi:fumarylacetoacetate hydrolase family protein [Myroides injenensis]|uniref:fumarylacetoacetate hydrolase family protein n=1 Tax=Myroides injenensis TaxID=1183151 RepID=UPI000289B28D|nr:fumarylacetoacetate hydrolase family protein [Myroides injenensis]
MKIVCIGRNYVEHIEELNNERPSEPLLFIKPDSALLGNQMPFVIPTFSNDIHYEIEVVVKINKVGKFIEPKFANKYYDEITVGIDFTARDTQQQLKEKGLPWEKAKSFDGSAVVGSFLPKDKIADIYNTDFSLTKNGEVVQKGNTAQMIWNIDEVIAEASKYFTLKKGDLIFTGTPVGVGRVDENDVLEGEIGGNNVFRITVK